MESLNVNGLYYMADIIYLTLKGSKQGLISAGCSSYDSIGNKYQENHIDEMLVYSTTYDLISDPVKIFVVSNYNWGIGHTGLVVGEGQDAILYDPAGGYSGCPSKKCYDNINEPRTLRSSGEFFDYPEFDRDDYLSFQLWDGPDVQLIEFTVPREQAEKIKSLIFLMVWLIGLLVREQF